MPDPRLETLADVLCRYSLEVQPGDLVHVRGPAVAQPLFVAVVERITRLGGHPLVRASLPAVEAAILEHASEEQLARVTRLEELEVEAPDKLLNLWAETNTRYLSAVPVEKQAAHRAARGPLFQRFEQRVAAGEMRWCGVLFPWHAEAQEAGMSLREWEELVYDAGHLDDKDPVARWREQSGRQQRVVDRLSQVSELRIVAEDTDLTVDVGGRTWLNADGRLNFPDGEVYTSPHEGRTRGQIAFTFPTTHDGHDVEGVRLEFEDGRVSRHSASKGEEFLARMLDMDRGARYLGEVAFGLNDDIQHATRNILLDEKIGGSCHLALGMAFAEAGGENASGLHWDMVCDLRRGGEVYGDGELIARDGRFL